MNTSSRLLAGILLAGTLLVSTADATAAAVADAPAAARFYPLLGTWKGQGQFAEAGQAPTPLKLALSCSKVASGWAVSCDMTASNDSMTISESDLMGVDPVTGTAHWYAVTNQGETHDHVAVWSGDKSMKAHYAWTQDGRKMEEHIAFVFPGRNSIAFRSVVTQDGKVAATFSAKLTQ